MTGATGNLTPDDAEQPFIPAELREISDPDPDHPPPHAEPPLGGGSTSDESDGDELSDHDERF